MSSTLCQNGSINSFLSVKLKVSCSFDHTILFKFQYHVVQTFSMEYMERL